MWQKIMAGIMDVVQKKDNTRAEKQQVAFVTTIRSRGKYTQIVVCDVPPCTIWDTKRRVAGPLRAIRNKKIMKLVLAENNTLCQITSSWWTIMGVLCVKCG